MDDNFINKEKRLATFFIFLMREGQNELNIKMDLKIFISIDLDESIFDKSFIELKDLRSQNLFLSY